MEKATYKKLGKEITHIILTEKLLLAKSMISIGCSFLFQISAFFNYGLAIKIFFFSFESKFEFL
jgi:hypothetical protein